MYCCDLDYRSSTIAGTMGTNSTRKNTRKSNTDAEDRNNNKLVDVENYAKDITIKHHKYLR